MPEVGRISTDTCPKPFDVGRALIYGRYRCTLSINRTTMQNALEQASFFFFFSVKITPYRARREFYLFSFSLSLSLPRKFTRRKPADGRDRRIRGYFRWFGSIRSAVSHSKHESVELFLVFTFPPPSSASFHLRPSHIARAGRVGMFRFWNLRVIPTTLSLVRRPSSGQVSNYGVRRFDKANLTNFLFDQLSRGGILRRN